MKSLIYKTLQWITCLLSWATISPLFYYLTWKWKMASKNFRIIYLFLSPLFLIIYAILVLLVHTEYYDYNRKHKFDNRKTLERITGAPFPAFKVVEYERGRTSFHGDYSDRLVIEFKEMPSNSFFQLLDSLVNVEGSDWSKYDYYYYNKMWGNGLPAPNGEDKDEDAFISIHLEKGVQQAEISYGAW